jgi:signal transduction histidine kinase
MTILLGFAPMLQLGGPLDSGVPAGVAEHLLGALREALSNAARHAAATSVEVRVQLQGDDLSLTVTDNGVGISPGVRRSGLANLEQRARECGGALSLEPPDGGGTQLRWQVPLSAEVQRTAAATWPTA